MSFFSNQKTWFFVAMFFMIVNIVMIVGSFTRRGRHHDKERMHHGHMGRGHKRAHAGFLHAKFIADTLGFSPEQRAQLEKVEEEINAKKDSVYSINEGCKMNFSHELFSENPDRAMLDSISRCISHSTEMYNKLRVEKVFRIRALCNKEQLEKFSAILSVMSERRFHGTAD